MKTLQNYITEKILINKNSKLAYNYHPKTKDELNDIIKQRIESEGNECDLNDIDISNNAIDLKTEIEKVREQIQNIE